MAKNKKRKHRTPIAPPIHSAPGTASAPRAPATSAPPSSPGGPDSPVATPASPVRPASKPRKPGGQASRVTAKRRKAKLRNYSIIGLVVALLVAAIVVPRVLSNRANAEFNALAKPAGCSGIQDTGKSGAGEHLGEGETTTYDSLPPSHGPHAQSTLPAGVYAAPLSDEPTDESTIFQAVHSLEHGAIIVWYKGLPKAQLDDLTAAYRDETKVLVVPYPELPGKTNHVAMTAWGRLVTCEKMSTKVIDAFIDRFREARTAPEPKNAI